MANGKPIIEHKIWINTNVEYKRMVYEIDIAAIAMYIHHISRANKAHIPTANQQSTIQASQLCHPCMYYVRYINTAGVFENGKYI